MNPNFEDFRKFLYPEKASGPDADADLKDDTRKDILTAITKKYGAENEDKENKQ